MSFELRSAPPVKETPAQFNQNWENGQAWKIQSDVNQAMGSGAFKNCSDAAHKEALTALMTDSRMLHSQSPAVQQAIEGDMRQLEQQHNFPHVTIGDSRGQSLIEGSGDVGNNGVTVYAGTKGAEASSQPPSGFTDLVNGDFGDLPNSYAGGRSWQVGKNPLW